MGETSSGEIPQIFQDLHNKPITEKAVQMARLDGNKVPESKKGRLNAVIGDELHGGLKDDKADLSLYGKIFNNPDQQDRNRRIETYKEALHSELLMDPNNVPESYFALQLKIGRERGQTGLVDNSPEARQKEGMVIHNDQEKSLDTWIDYLADPDASYPTWFKYYVLTSVSKMGVYDKENHEFSKRTKDTTTIFPDLNREALAYVYDSVQKYYLKHEKHDDEELNRILDTANFSKIYAFAIDKVTPASKENKEKTEGDWTIFRKTDEAKGIDDSIALYESLQGHGTGWCTAGEETAKQQLKGGKFHVYYSKDEDGNYTIPRIAIRMGRGEVAEVRGIDHNQNLEANMVDIARERYRPLPGGEKFDKKDHDMKLLTLIDEKVNDNQELTEDEIKFLYEIKGPIEGFGFGKDPRIKEIRDKRNPKFDAPIIWDFQPNEIAWSQEELNNETKVYIGPLFSDIFTKHKDLKKICTSFTSSEIRRGSLEVVSKSIEQIEMELKKSGIIFDNHIKELMENSQFMTLKSPEVFDLIHLTVSDLGLTVKRPTTEELYERAEQFGLTPCPPEVGPELILKYKGQPFIEDESIAMKPIESDDEPYNFSIAYDGDSDKLSLESEYGGLDSDNWGSGNKLVFSLRK